MIAKALTETRTEDAKKIRKLSRQKGNDFSPRRGKEIKLREDNNANTVTSTQGVEQLICIQKTGGYCTTIKDNETGCLQSGGANVMDKVPNVVISHYGHTNKDAVISEISPTLKANSHGHEPMIGNTNMSGETFENDFAGTLRAGASHNYQLVNNIRRLTEIECERLQGYPDDWTKFGIYEKQVWINKKLKTFEIIEQKHKIPRTQRYKLCGNAVTKNIVELIGKKLLNQ